MLRYEIWDTAGQERFHSLAPMYYRNAQAAVVVYDVTKAASLEKAKSWVKELQRQANPNIVIALAGNKIDLVSGQAATSAAPKPPAPTSSSEDEDEADDATATPGGADGDGEGSESLREVPKEEALAYATEANLLFTEISAKTGEGIVELFTDIGMDINPGFLGSGVSLLMLTSYTAKKIPIEHILASRGGAANAAASTPQARGVALDEQAKAKEGCAC